MHQMNKEICEKINLTKEENAITQAIKAVQWFVAVYMTNVRLHKIFWTKCQIELIPHTFCPIVPQT